MSTGSPCSASRFTGAAPLAQAPDPAQYLTFEQTVEAVAWLTPRRLRSFVAEGVLPKRKARGRLLFCLDEVLALVEEARVPPDLDARVRAPRIEPGGPRPEQAHKSAPRD